MKSTKTPPVQKTAPTVFDEKTSSIISIHRILVRPVGLVSRAWRWMREQQVSRSTAQKLKLEHSISLGQKRFAAVIEVQGMRFLVGGGASNVELLARLEDEASFGKVLDRTKSKSISRRVKAVTEKKKAIKKSSPKADQAA